MADTTYQPLVYREQGGARQVIASGGSCDVESGGEIDIESGGALKLAGTALTATAAEINKLASAGAVVASGTAAAHIVDLKADYANTDIDDAGTINGTELAVVLNLITARCNALVARLEAFKINASS